MSDIPVRVRRQVLLIDPHGLHLRRAARVVVLAKSFRSELRLIAGGVPADARSILELLTLAAGCGTRIDLAAHGPDAEEAVAALADLIGNGLDGAARGMAAA